MGYNNCQYNLKYVIRDDEEKHLIYNYEPFYSGKDGRDFGFQQVYLFQNIVAT